MAKQTRHKQDRKTAAPLKQGFRVRLDEDTHVYGFFVQANGARDDMIGAWHPAAGAGIGGLLHRPSCTYTRSSGPLLAGLGKTYVQKLCICT
jgi:hypothetical protein